MQLFTLATKRPSAAQSFDSAGNCLGIIAGLSKPLTVVLERRARAVTIFLIFLLFAFLVEFLLAAHRSDLNDIPGIALFVILCLLALTIIREKLIVGRSNRRLIEAGECAVGRIISQKRVRERRGPSASKIVYSFPVGCGKPMTGQGTDETASYTEGMAVLVFYDPDDTSQNVAYCSTSWRIRSNEGHLLLP
jgi:hypothetical protein